MDAYQIREPAILLLEDGRIFEGRTCGIKGTAVGEICFNTGMTGYQETFTDPSYFGQILVSTHVHIGNYGVHKHEIESESVKIAGLVCKDFIVKQSRHQASGSLQDYFQQHNVVGICDIDTRALVRHIRNKGVMRSVICSENKSRKELEKIIEETPKMQGLALADKVTTTKVRFNGKQDADIRIAVLDMGIKENIVRCLTDLGCFCKVFPYPSTLASIKEWQPDGILISNGPGDPDPLKPAIELTKQLIADNFPIFGICLGHQVISLAMGVSTKKMFSGHRGINHPVLNINTGKGEITSQNHGFVTDAEALSKNKDIELTHKHLNDNSVAGLKLKNKPVMSVQYHPEASAGPHDSRYLFEEFLKLVRQTKKVHLEPLKSEKRLKTEENV